MRRRNKTLTVLATMIVLPWTSSASANPGMIESLASTLNLTVAQAQTRLAQQEEAHHIWSNLPQSLVDQTAGKWFDSNTGKLTIAVTTKDASDSALAAGAEPRIVSRSKAELDRIIKTIDRENLPGVNSYGVDEVANDVVVTVNRARKTEATQRFLSNLNGVRVTEVDTTPTQQAGQVRPGDSWWPGSETPCSVGFTATDTSGGKHFLTAGHCTNDANQAAYGRSGQQNRLGTSNVGGARSINGREGDMGVVAVAEAGWTTSASVNTYGGPSVSVSGSMEAIVGDAVCHSGGTAPNWECGTVSKVDQTVTYGGNLVISGLTFTTACSQGGDSGGAWLSGSKGVGLHEGGLNGNSCPAGDNAIFQPVNEALKKWNLTLETSTGGGGERSFSNGTDQPIRDFRVATSSITSTATGAAGNPITVQVTASHTCTEDLNINLVAPGGRSYAMQRAGGLSCTPFPGTKSFSVVRSGEQAAGTWTLRVGDNGPGDIGTLDSWTITL